jgi:hypothetical protein
LNDPLHISTECLAVGMIERAGDRIGDGVGVVSAVAVREDEGRREVEVIGAGAGAVAQQESSAHGVEAEVGTSSGIAAAGWLLHITKLSIRDVSATPEFSTSYSDVDGLLTTLLKGPACCRLPGA